MIKPAILYTQQLEKCFADTFFNPKYYYYNVGYGEIPKIDNNNWNKHQFVSVDSNDNIVGYISYNTDRFCKKVNHLCAINFTNNKAIFGIDLGRAIKDVFELYHFNKMNFSVVIGNPIESSYDKMCLKYGGRIIGIYKNDVVLQDNKFYDMKVYEITAKEYFKTKEERRQ